MNYLYKICSIKILFILNINFILYIFIKYFIFLLKIFKHLNRSLFPCFLFIIYHRIRILIKLLKVLIF